MSVIIFRFIASLSDSGGKNDLRNGKQIILPSDSFFSSSLRDLSRHVECYAPLEIAQAEAKLLRQMTKLFIYRSLGLAKPPFQGYIAFMAATVDEIKTNQTANARYIVILENHTDHLQDVENRLRQLEHINQLYMLFVE